MSAFYDAQEPGLRGGVVLKAKVYEFDPHHYSCLRNRDREPIGPLNESRRPAQSVSRKTSDVSRSIEAEGNCHRRRPQRLSHIIKKF